MFVVTPTKPARGLPPAVGAAKLGTLPAAMMAPTESVVRVTCEPAVAESCGAATGPATDHLNVVFGAAFVPVESTTLAEAVSGTATLKPAGFAPVPTTLTTSGFFFVST